MTRFPIQDIERPYEVYLAAPDKLDALTAAYVATRFRDERTRAFARHGFLRRLALMLHCIERTMEDLPPRPWISHAQGILDATVCLQAFVTDVFGCIDNLAHIWVTGKGLTAQDGTPLADSRIGLRPENRAVLDSLSPVFAGYLKRLGPWFEYLETYRRALEHHVPLSVSPDSVPQPRLRQYGKIGERILIVAPHKRSAKRGQGVFSVPDGKRHQHRGEHRAQATAGIRLTPRFPSSNCSCVPASAEAPALGEASIRGKPARSFTADGDNGTDRAPIFLSRSLNSATPAPCLSP